MSLPPLPAAAAALVRQAIDLHVQGRLAAAVDCYRQLLAQDHCYPQVHYNLGVALCGLGRFAEAAGEFHSAIALRSDYAEAWSNLGLACKSCNQLDAAIAAYREAVRLQPALADAHSNLGNALHQRGELQAAVMHCRRAIELQPQHAQACNNLGNSLKALGDHAGAMQSYQRALQIKADYAEVHANVGHLYQEQGAIARAIASYRRALQLQQRFPEALGNYCYLVLDRADWRHYESLRAAVINGVSAGHRGFPVLPFLAVTDAAELQLRCAQTHVTANHPPVATAPALPARHGGSRITVAYLSADLRDHAVSYLAGGLFALHDRQRFNVIAISLAKAADSDLGRRVRGSFDQFIEVHDKDDHAVATLIRQLGVDILVDLMGFTRQCRPNILAHRPAPVQINYLGFPATMGAPYIDYILADDYLIPPRWRGCYAEQVVCLPDCFQVNDAQRFRPDSQPTRAEHGLPATGFVFCCFNNTYKINPPVFDCWMRLLQHVAGSVLWLVATDDDVQAALRAEAGRRNVDPQRLVFAPRVPYHAHLLRLQLADLFLDTFPFNAGTTASDALWVGVPIVTCSGEAMASRMAGSLLQACDLAELITDNLPDYESLAARLATDAAWLQRCRATLAEQRQQGPLFDTARFCRHLETAYITMVDRHRQQLPAAGFDVAAVAG